jgi:uridine kinase
MPAKLEDTPLYLPAYLDVKKTIAADGGVFIIAIDGRSASGKTTFAEDLAQNLGAFCAHTDDFYLPLEARSRQPLKKPAGHIDIARLKREVLEPASAGKGFLYTPYCCHTGQMNPARKIPPQKIIIIEGAYSMHPDIAGFYDYKIFMTLTPEAQRERILKRSSSHVLEVFKEKWLPAEELYFKETDPQAKADYLLDTSAAW